MIFRQLHYAPSGAYSYLLGDEASHAALVIDPVAEQADLILALLCDLRLSLSQIIATHGCSGRASGARRLAELTGCPVRVGCGGQGGRCTWADKELRDGESIDLGGHPLQIIATPGHTPCGIACLWRDRLFTGDTLLINNCGRVDLPASEAGQLYDSVVRRLFALPGETLIFPGHDSDGRTVSTIAEERARNPRFVGRSRDSFVTLMAGVNRQPSPFAPLAAAPPFSQQDFS
jgi:sulfur dioxygenase